MKFSLFIRHPAKINGNSMFSKILEFFRLKMISNLLYKDVFSDNKEKNVTGRRLVSFRMLLE